MQRTRARFGLLLGALTLVGASAGLATSASASGEQVEIDWWHIQINDPGYVELAGHGRRLHGREPERHDQHHGDGERGVQGGAPDQRPGRRRPRPVPVLGRRRAARPGRTPARCRTSPRHPPSTSTPSARVRPDCSTSTASSTGCRTTRASSASGTTRTSSSRPARSRGPAGDVDRAARGHPDAQGRRHHADRRRCRRQVAGALLVLLPDGPPRRCRRDEPDRRRQQLQRPRRHRGRRARRRARRHGAVPGRLPRRHLGRSRR